MDQKNVKSLENPALYPCFPEVRKGRKKHIFLVSGNKASWTAIAWSINMTPFFLSCRMQRETWLQYVGCYVQPGEWAETTRMRPFVAQIAWLGVGVCYVENFRIFSTQRVMVRNRYEVTSYVRNNPVTREFTVFQDTPPLPTFACPEGLKFSKEPGRKSMAGHYLHNVQLLQKQSVLELFYARTHVRWRVDRTK